LKLFTKIVDRCIDVLAGLAALILLAMLVGVTFATFSRYLANKPFAAIIDLSGYALVFVAFLAAPWLMARRGHVSIDLLIEKFSPKVQKYWTAVVSFVMIPVAAIIAYIGALLTYDYLLTDVIMADMMDTPQWILLFPIPLGSFFLALRSLINGVEDIKEARKLSADANGSSQEGARN